MDAMERQCRELNSPNWENVCVCVYNDGDI